MQSPRGDGQLDYQKQQYHYMGQESGYFEEDFNIDDDTFQGLKSRSEEFLDRTDSRRIREPVYISAAPRPSDVPKVAVQRISDKYDSLGKVKGHVNVSYDPNIALSDGFGSLNLGGTDVDEDDPNEVSEQDVLQVEAFFRSHKTYVFVCRALANLYYAATSTVSNSSSWRLAHTGIPTLLLDKGNTRARTDRRIQIVLAEKGSGFLLWRDVIDHLSAYKAPNASFHTMYISSDHRKIVGLSFDNKMAAMEFYDQVETLTSDPANISLSGPKKKGQKAKNKCKPEKAKAPKKSDISQPCCFQHITKMDTNEGKHLLNMASVGDERKHSI